MDLDCILMQIVLLVDDQLFLAITNPLLTTLIVIVNIIVYLTNRFHFAVRLYSDNAQMTSKCGENKDVRYSPAARSVTDVLTTF